MGRKRETLGKNATLYCSWAVSEQALSLNQSRWQNYRRWNSKIEIGLFLMSFWWFTDQRVLSTPTKPWPSGSPWWFYIAVERGPFIADFNTKSIISIAIWVYLRKYRAQCQPDISKSHVWLFFGGAVSTVQKKGPPHINQSTKVWFLDFLTSHLHLLGRSSPNMFQQLTRWWCLPHRFSRFQLFSIWWLLKQANGHEVGGNEPYTMPETNHVAIIFNHPSNTGIPSHWGWRLASVHN